MRKRETIINIIAGIAGLIIGAIIGFLIFGR